jgi:hypothetical protein
MNIGAPMTGSRKRPRKISGIGIYRNIMAQFGAGSAK